MVATVPLGTVVTVQNLGKKKKKEWLMKPNSKMKAFLLSPYKTK